MVDGPTPVSPHVSTLLSNVLNAVVVQPDPSVAGLVHYTLVLEGRPEFRVIPFGPLFVVDVRRG
ncbi:MAG: hypothetical protein OEY23_12330 [Acidimicrobiia bacterium]|nr:hypothetical protein [Acidimicrobiia bacterium]